MFTQIEGYENFALMRVDSKKVASNLKNWKGVNSSRMPKESMVPRASQRISLPAIDISSINYAMEIMNSEILNASSAFARMHKASTILSQSNRGACLAKSR